MTRPSRIAFFVSGHGYGHGVRDAALIDALPPETELSIFSPLPAEFFREEVHHAYTLIPCELDCGTIQRDAVETDAEASLDLYLSIEARRGEHVARFAPQLASLKPDLALVDAAALAFPVARAAGVPAWGLHNFTWVDIYRPLVERLPRYLPMLRRMEADYALAQKHLRLFPSMDGPDLGPAEDVGLLCKPGVGRRAEFAQKFGIDPGKKWCTVYLGDAGLGGVSWERLARFPDWEFLGLYDLPGAPANYRRIRKDRGYRYADLTASCDLVLGKLGYSLIAGCLSLGKPVLFLLRRGFSEYAMLKETVESRGLGREISLEAFRALDFERELREVTGRTFTPLAASGTADILAKMGFSRP